MLEHGQTQRRKASFPPSPNKMKNKVLTAAAAGLTAASAFATDPTMPDPATYVATLQTVAISAAAVGATILVWRIGKAILSKLVKG